MRFIEKAEEAVWRAIEWSFVMGMLSWLFVRLWSETVYDPQRARGGRRRQSLWARLRFSARQRREPSGDERSAAGPPA